MNAALRTRFALPANEQELRTAIEGICAEFGSIAYLKILPASQLARFQCACFVRLEPPEAHEALSSMLDVHAFNGDAGFFADVAEDWTGPTM